MVIVGAQTSAGVTRGLTINLFNVSGPGTYALGVSSDVLGGTGSVGEGTGTGNAQSWITDNTGSAGTITLTTLSVGRIAGTFSYVAAPGHSNTVGGIRTVTDGSIDLPFGGTLVPVPANVGEHIERVAGKPGLQRLDGQRRRPQSLGGSGLQLSSLNKDHGVSFTLSGVSAPGTYALSNSGTARLMGAGHNGGDADHCCWGGGNTGADVGSVTITSLTADRVKGTFSATLQPVPGKPATTPLTVTSGTFDVGFR